MTLQTDDPQDPLPESQFFFRRIFSYAISVSLLVLLAVIVWHLDDSHERANTAFWLIILLWWVITYYMIAPSAEQIVRLIQAARVIAAGLPFKRSADHKPLQPRKDADRAAESRINALPDEARWDDN